MTDQAPVTRRVGTIKREFALVLLSMELVLMAISVDTRTRPGVAKAR